MTNPIYITIQFLLPVGGIALLIWAINKRNKKAAETGADKDRDDPKKINNIMILIVVILVLKAGYFILRAAAGH